MIRFSWWLFLFPGVSFAFEPPAQDVLVRDGAFRPVIQRVKLPDLISDDSFDGKHFKIVAGKSNEAIRFGSGDSAFLLRAATVYFHLARAREFWVQKLESESVANLEKIVVRIDLPNGFSDLAHFQNDTVNPEFNNAVSIPAGRPLPGLSIEPWGREIWFRPVKRIRTRDLPESGLGGARNPLAAYVRALASMVGESAVSRLVQTTLQAIFFRDLLPAPYPQVVLRDAGTMALASLFLREIWRIDRLFMKKYYYLDTAMVPEIIHHEFAHIALSDQLELTRSTPVIEGLADYFATAISGNPDLAARIRRYSGSIPKRGRNRVPYSPEAERFVYANSDFVLSVLWLVRDRFPAVADRLILHASSMLSTGSSDIRHDLIRALLESCREKCADPRRDRLELIRAFEEKGF